MRFKLVAVIAMAIAGATITGRRPMAPRDEALVLGAAADTVLGRSGVTLYLVDRDRLYPSLGLTSWEPDSLPVEVQIRQALQKHGVAVDIVESFIVANRDSSAIPVPRSRRVPVVINTVPAMSDSEAARLARTSTPPFFKQGFERYSDAYPGARQLASFSRVGFSKSGTDAIVVSGYFCGMLCGSGDLVILHRTRGAWRVTRVENLWVS